ncbi:MAG: hypothetical protein ABSA15_07215, partial [Thermoplasmata archaeon]
MRRDRRAEPYPVVESLRRYRKAITESLPSANAQPILAFLDKCAADGLTAHRQVFYASHLKPIAQLLGAAFPNPSRKDIEKLLAEIESRDYEVWTKIGYKTTTKRFY